MSHKKIIQFGIIPIVLSLVSGLVFSMVNQNPISEIWILGFAFINFILVFFSHKTIHVLLYIFFVLH